jgi:hypothetical protein
MDVVGPSNTEDPPEDRPSDPETGGQKDKKDKKDTILGGLTPYSDPTRLPKEAFAYLPHTIAGVADHLDGHDKDVYLTSVLPVFAAALDNVVIRYMQSWEHLNLYASVAAPPSAGKGVVGKAREVGEKLHHSRLEESERKIEEWERIQADETESLDGGERPIREMLYLPADISAAKLKELMQANPSGLIFDKDSTTLETVLNREWGGGIRDLLLKGFHSEGWMAARQYKDDLLNIESPAPSVVVAGVPHSIREVIQGPADGLFSRFLFYTFYGQEEFKNPFSDQENPQLQAQIDETAERVEEISEAVGNRVANWRSEREQISDSELSEMAEQRDPTFCKMPAELGQTHVAVFSTLLQRVRDYGAAYELEPSVKRAGVIAHRIACISAIVRAYEHGADIFEAKSIIVSEQDLAGALYLTCAYLNNTIRFLNREASARARAGLKAEQLEFLDALPGGSFETRDAKDVALDLDIGPTIDATERKSRRWLQRFVDEGLLIDAAHGEWRRPDRLPMFRYRPLIQSCLDDLGDLDDEVSTKRLDELELPFKEW